MFEQLSTNTTVRDSILKCSGDHVTLTDQAAQAIFEWVFKEPSHLDAEKNTNIFYAHRNVGNLAKMKRYDDINKTTFADSYDVEDPSKAEPMRNVFDLEFTAAVNTSDNTKVLENCIKQLHQISNKQMEHEGDTIRELLVQIRDIAKRTIDRMGKFDG